MKALPLFFLTMAIAASAQRIDETQLASKLTQDLLPLRSALVSTELLKDSAYGRTELDGLVSVAQYNVMEACQKDLLLMVRAYSRTVQKPEDAAVNFRSLIGPDQAFKLTHALAGKDLSESNVRPLAEGIVEMTRSALDCSNNSCSLQGSPAFRTSAQNTRDALRTLGLTDPDLRIVTDALFRGARRAAAQPERTTYR